MSDQVASQAASSAARTVETREQQLSPKKTAKKRTKASSKDDQAAEDADADQKKKRPRGRPRVDTKDHSAVDRRRTQIRLAQRAYRSRKDQFVDDLEQHIKDLEAKNQAMANEFAGFLNYLATTGVTQAMPDLARRCRDIHLKLPSFADRGIQESDDQYSNTSPDSRKSVSPNSDQLQQPSESSLSTQTTFALPYFPDPLVQSNQQAPLFGQNFTAWNPDSYEILAKPTAENASFPVYSDPVMPQQASASASYLCPSLPAPTSYASQELSFGRRLQRTSLEAGLSLVGMASPSPDRYAAVFGFCLLFESKLDIAARLSRCLQATAEENLCAWQFPFHTLGGAGLNYTDSAKGAADSGSDGGGARPNHQAMGPFTATVEDARDKFLDRGLSVRYEDFKGNFLDPAEVEIYLRRRGVEVPVNSDFVDVEVNPRHFADDAVHLDENLWQQPDQTPPTHASAAQEPSMGSLGPQLFTDGTSSGAPDVSSPNLFYCPAIPVDWWTPRGSVKATLNVNLFLEKLVQKTVCLGRSPGMRAKDINSAFKIATGMKVPGVATI